MNWLGQPEATYGHWPTATSAQVKVVMETIALGLATLDRRRWFADRPVGPAPWGVSPPPRGAAQHWVPETTRRSPTASTASAGSDGRLLHANRAP